MRRDRRRRREGRRRRPVSIPYWVFYASRQLEGVTFYDKPVLFQSRTGFSMRRDLIAHHPRGTSQRFQSRTGFSMRRDSGRSRDRRPARGVSIPYWVFYASRLSHSRRPYPSFATVSIPYWVFYASRPALRRPPSRRDTGFNPVLGFLCVATQPKGLVRTRLSPFQSRTGFSMRRDGGARSLEVESIQFQSRTGFSMRRDGHNRRRTTPSGRFQSRTGFSMRRDFVADLLVRPCARVSIPYWVFYASRPISTDPRESGRAVSIPYWVFYASRPDDLE